VLAVQGQQQLNVSETNPTIYIQCFIAIHKMLTGPLEIGYARHRPTVPTQMKTTEDLHFKTYVFIKFILSELTWAS
jgi:hypothetical protein